MESKSRNARWPKTPSHLSLTRLDSLQAMPTAAIQSPSLLSINRTSNQHLVKIGSTIFTSWISKASLIQRLSASILLMRKRIGTLNIPIIASDTEHVEATDGKSNEILCYTYAIGFDETYCTGIIETKSGAKSDRIKLAKLLATAIENALDQEAAFDNACRSHK